MRIPRVHFSLWAAAFILVAAGPARSGVPVSTSLFSLTFPDGWVHVPSEGSEFPVVVLDTALDVSCLMVKVPLGLPMALKDIKAPASSYSRGDSVFKVAEGTMNLGSREFLFAEYHGQDSAGQTKQVRAYYDLYDSTRMLGAFIDYLSPKGSADVAVFEKALSTLSYSVPVHVLPKRMRTRPGGFAARHDALGRPRQGTAPSVGFPH